MPVSSRTSPSHFAGHPLQARKRPNIWPRHYEKEVRRRALQRFLPVVFSQRPGKFPQTSVPGHLLRCKFTQIPLLNEWSAASARRNFSLPAGGLLSRRQIAGRCDGKAALWVGGSDLHGRKLRLCGADSQGISPASAGKRGGEVGGVEKFSGDFLRKGGDVWRRFGFARRKLRLGARDPGGRAEKLPKKEM